MREYTVKEFSERAKVTPQAIYKQIGNPESLIQQYVVKRGGKTYIQDLALQAIYRVEQPVKQPVEQPGLNGSTTDETEFSNQLNNQKTRVDQPLNHESGSQSDDFAKEYIASLNAQIDYLKRQIEEKDAHIIEITALASKALSTTTQQQYLTAVATSSKPDEQVVDKLVEQPSIEVEKPVEQVVQPEKRRGWLHRLFFNEN